jgi:DNA polymerase I-like protein with 3'-5' exonuclease and polymerase domains
MAKVAIIETKKSRTDYKSHFDFEFDQYVLASDASLKKILKKDVDIDINIDNYDWVILVGSEPLKFFTKVTSVTEYSGKIVQDKFIPIINPAMLAFKPESKTLFDESKQKIIGLVSGADKGFVLDSSYYVGINDTKEALAYIQEAIDYPADEVALDSETSALYPRNGHILGISLCYKPDFGAYISIDCFTEEVESKLQELFNKKNIVFHNAKFDKSWFIYHFGWKFPRSEDTMLLHYLIDENPGTHGLKQLALKYTKFGDYEKELEDWRNNYCKTHGILKEDFSYEYIPFEVMVPYASLDSVVTLAMYYKLKPVIDKNKKLANVYNNILMPGSEFLIKMENNGVPFDKDRLVKAQALMQEDIDKAIEELYTHEIVAQFEQFQGKKFNPNSVNQLRVLLFDFLKLRPSKKTKKGAHSTDAEVLEQLSDQHEVPRLILAIRQKAKIKNTYLDKIIPQLDRDSRLRTNFNLHSTTSGRLSSSGKLNMQQLPRDNPIVKGCIKAAPGHKIVSMDLKTAEVYIAAVVSKDEALMDVFRNKEDFHSSIAKRVFALPCKVEDIKTLYPEKRSAVKAVTFGILYGAGPDKISSEVTKETGTLFSVTEAEEVITDYFNTFKKLKKWIDGNKKFILENGFIYSFFGRKRRLANVKSEDKGTVAHTVRSGINFLVQSPSSDVNVLGAIDMQGYIDAKKMKARIFALVHDSILAEVPDDEIDHYKKMLEHFIQLDRGVSIPGVPIMCDFEIGEDYSTGKFEKTYEDLV